MFIYKLNYKKINLFIFFVLLIFISLFVYYKFNINKFSLSRSCIFNKINKNNLINVIYFIKNKHDIYSFINILKLSKYYANHGRLKDAEYWLKYGIRYIHDDNLKLLFSVRLVRILYEENKFNESLVLINRFIHIDSWKCIFLNIKGDILLNMGDKRAAKKVWLSILHFDNDSIFNQLIKIKINSIF